MKSLVKLLFNASIILLLASGCTQNLNTNDDIHCYQGHTSLGETTKACIKYTNSDYRKTLNFTENLKYKEVVVEKLVFARDYIQLNNHLVVPKLEIYIPEMEKSVSITPVFVDKSWIDKGLGIGSILRHEPNGDYDVDYDERYYVIGYLDNVDKEGLYRFYNDDADINDYNWIYGSCGRRCHYFPLEVIEYKSDLKGNNIDAYKKEIFPELNDTTESCKNLFSEEECSSAVDFAKKLKYVFRNKDFETFADIIPYPVTIAEIETSKGKEKNSITINSKRELLNLDKGKIMNDKIFKVIDENGIFVNWKGFMLGQGEFWWFQSGNETSGLSINIFD